MKVIYKLLLTMTLGLSIALPHEKTQTQELKPEERIYYPPVVKLHPPTTHFSVALPTILLLASLYYALTKRREKDLIIALSVLSFLAILSSVITGYIIHESIENIPIQEEAEEVLHRHESIGFALFGMSLVVSLLSFLINKSLVFRVLHLILCFVLVFGVFYQGSLGGKLVYEYSVGVPVR
ncbi:DUF2231 domain-containing protein [Thermocrinis sp.]|uniref:DUF2231 domain-containing protein n=1 Tax=Thermocrinis sp. TaxID=2024383 RepID=UPI002FDD260D